MRERKLVERAVRISGMFVLLSGMGLQPCLASHSYNAALAGVVQVEQQKQNVSFDGFPHDQKILDDEAGHTDSPFPMKSMMSSREMGSTISWGYFLRKAARSLTRASQP